MAITIDPEDNGSIMVVHARGKLTREDYQRFVPEVERLIARYGRISVLFEMHEFHGWAPARCAAGTRPL
jgi:hypothetical protein